jgi:hypothetical protein
VQVAEQEAGGIADAAVGIGHALQDLVGNVHFLAVIGRRHPQAQDVGPQRVHDLLRGDHVALGLRHLAALGIDGKAVGQHLAIRCHAMHRDRGQQRGLEPAAMLVGAFQVQIGRAVNSSRWSSTQ